MNHKADSGPDVQASPLHGSRYQGAATEYAGRWVILDAAGQMLLPPLQQRAGDIEVSLRFGYMVLRAAGMLRLDIPLDVIEDDDSVQRQGELLGRDITVVDEGDLAAAWVSQWLDTPARLFKIHPDAPGLAQPATH